MISFRPSRRAEHPLTVVVLRIPPKSTHHERSGALRENWLENKYMHVIIEAAVSLKDSISMH